MISIFLLHLSLMCIRKIFPRHFCQKFWWWVQSRWSKPVAVDWKHKVLWIYLWCPASLLQQKRNFPCTFQVMIPCNAPCALGQTKYQRCMLPKIGTFMVLHMVKDKKLSYMNKQLWLVQIRGLGRKWREWMTALCSFHVGSQSDVRPFTHGSQVLSNTH